MFKKYFLFLLPVAILTVLYLNSNLTANNEKLLELESYVQQSKNTDFNNVFQNEINTRLEDGKLSNSDFVELQDIFNNLKANSLADNHANKVSSIESKNESFSKIITAILIYVFIIILAFGCAGSLKVRSF